MTVPDVTPDPPGRAWRVALGLLSRLPQASLSRGLGGLADLRIPRRARRTVLGAFARAVGIDTSEAERPLVDYETLNELFVRRLRPGARTWTPAPGSVASPVDGVVGQVGLVQAGRVIQAKGKSFAAADLLGHSLEAERFEGGHFVTLYLAPRHYHRIHAPVRARVPLARHVPGRLLPVNAASVAQIGDLFPRNERVVAFLDSDVGRIALVAVGAYNVGRISVAFDPAWSGPEAGWVTNRKDPVEAERRYDPPAELELGDEIMAFHLGSTVVLLFEPGELTLLAGCGPGAEVRAGQRLLACP